MRVTSKLSSRVRTSIIEGMGEEGKFSLSLFFFAEQSSATRRTDRKRRRFFAMAVVAGIQWEDRFYSGLNPVMPARVASRSHSRTRLRTRACVCVSVCRSLAPPRNGRCRCRCLSLSLSPFSLFFLSPFLSPLFPIVFSLPSFFLSPSSIFLYLYLSTSLPTACLVALPLAGQRLVSLARKRREEESFERRKKYALAGYYYTDGVVKIARAGRGA